VLTGDVVMGEVADGARLWRYGAWGMSKLVPGAAGTTSGRPANSGNWKSPSGWLC